MTLGEITNIVHHERSKTIKGRNNGTDLQPKLLNARDLKEDLGLNNNSETLRVLMAAYDIINRTGYGAKF